MITILYLTYLDGDLVGEHERRRCSACTDLTLVVAGDRLCPDCQADEREIAASMCQVCDTGQSSLWHYCVYEGKMVGIEPDSAELTEALRVMHMEYARRYVTHCDSCGEWGWVIGGVCGRCIIRQAAAERMVMQLYVCPKCGWRGGVHQGYCPNARIGRDDIPF